MSGLVEFLLARITEDERRAQRFTVRQRWMGHDIHYGNTASGEDQLWIYSGGQRQFIEPAEMYEPADPDPRLIAECAAKRAIIGYAETATGYDMQIDSEWGCGRRNEKTDPYLGDEILRALAAPYSNHPDFLGEWTT